MKLLVQYQIPLALRLKCPWFKLPSALLLVLFTFLQGCKPTLDNTVVETQIQSQLSSQKGISLKAVLCPQKVIVAKDASFTCIGELNPTGTFPINVTQLDAQGTVKWQIPNSKGLLNLSLLETEFGKAIASDAGIGIPGIDCGGDYRVNKPGDRFECQVINAQPIREGQNQSLLTSVVVSLDDAGNVSWQQIRRQQVIARSLSTSKTSSQILPPSPTASPQKETTRNSVPSASPPQPQPTAQTADDFLNNPNAADGF